MADETKKETFITLDFSGTKKKFADIGELREFMQSQRDAWSWLEQAAREDDNLAQVWDPFKRYFMQVDQFIEGLEREPDDQAKQTEQINILKSQTKIAVNQGFTLADTPSARFILDLKDDKSPQIAGYALASLNKEKINPDDLAANEGVYLAMQYLQGSTADSIKAQQRWADRFEKQHGELEDSNKQLIRKATELQEQSDLLASRAEDQANSQADIFEQQTANHEKRFSEQAAELQEQFNSLTERAKEQTNSQANIFKQQVGNQEEIFKNQVVKHRNDITNQMANQEKNFREQATELQEKTDLLTKKAKEQTTTQVTISKQQIAKHLNILIGQRYIQAYKFRQQALKYENDFFNRSNSHERRFGEQTTKLTDDFVKQSDSLINDFRVRVAKHEGEFKKLHTRTVDRFKVFEKFLNLGAPYNEAVKFWQDKQKKHIKVRGRERAIAVFIALVTAFLFSITALLMFSENDRTKTAKDTIINTILDIIMPDAAASDAATCGSVACNPVVCSPVPGAPGLCDTVAGSSLTCGLVPCGSTDCKAVDCNAVDCNAVDCKAVDCKTAPCEPAASSTTATLPTINVANVTINDYIDNPEKVSLLLSTTISTTAKVDAKPKSDPLEDVWKVSILLMISTLGFWLTRVSARGFVSNQHLEMDCRERITILFTYFALQKSDSPLRGNERPIVLETLFRPGATGLIKDDGPANILETLLKATKKR